MQAMYTVEEGGYIEHVQVYSSKDNLKVFELMG